MGKVDEFTEIFDLKNGQEYLREVMELEHMEWSSDPITDKESKIEKKVNKYLKYVNDKYFCKLILLDKEKLVGFISIFPKDGEIDEELTPWYATMYVKKDIRYIKFMI